MIAPPHLQCHVLDEMTVLARHVDDQRCCMITQGFGLVAHKHLC